MNEPWKRLTLTDGTDELAAFEKSGDDSLAPVVLLHGAGGNALTWLPLAEMLGRRGALLVDMPAHGMSPSPQSWTLEQTAATVARLVARHFGDRASIWGGHSWGGKVSGFVAASNEVRGLMLFDPSPSAAVPVDIEAFVDGTWSVEMQRYATPEDAAAAARSLRHWQPWDDTIAAAFRYGLAKHDDGTWSLRPKRDDLVALATATLHHDASETLAANSRVPTLLVVAEESSPWQGITNMVVYAGATQVVIPGHHWIHLCSRDAVVAAATKWLEQQP